MRILITGASGLLGSKLVELSIKKGYEVYSGFYGHKPSDGFPVRVDVSDRNSVEKTFKIAKPDVVIHAAALTNVDKCEVDKELAWSINVVGTKNIVEQSKKFEAFLIYVSTDYVFDGEKGMYKETDDPNPINYYGLTKLEGEKIVADTLDDYCIVRSSVIYGARPASGKINFALWVIKQLKNGKTINIVTDQYVSPTLNTNLAEMILEIAERRLTGIYHLAGATRISRYEFARLIAETFNLSSTLIAPIKMNTLKWIAKRPRDSSLNVSKAKNDLHNPPLEIEDALKKLKEELRVK